VRDLLPQVFLGVPDAGAGSAGRLPGGYQALPREVAAGAWEGAAALSWSGHAVLTKRSPVYNY